MQDEKPLFQNCPATLPQLPATYKAHQLVFPNDPSPRWPMQKKQKTDARHGEIIANAL